MQKKTGFTLIELLVVIAIIAIVAAILFPVFASAKAASKKTVAISNVDQIGKAVHMYLADNDDHLPFRFPIQPEWKGYQLLLFISGPGLSDIFQPYLKSKDVWFSPEDKRADKGFTSFCLNEQLAFDWSMSSIPRPAEAIYLTDRSDIDAHPPVDTYAWWTFNDAHPFTETGLPGTIDPISVASQIAPIRYVGNVGVYLFLDSHAATMPFERTWGDAAHNLHLATKS